MEQRSESRAKVNQPVTITAMQHDDRTGGFGDLSSKAGIHLGPEELRCFSLGQLSEVENEVVQIHLAGCESCQRVLSNALDDAAWCGTERRREIRTAVDAPASIKLLDPITSTSPPQHGRVIEISRNGMKLRAQRLMFRRTLIQVRVQGKMVLGVVKSCVRDGDEFQIGVQLVKDFPSS
jgi:hypothetical protein